MKVLDYSFYPVESLYYKDLKCFALEHTAVEPSGIISEKVYFYYDNMFGMYTALQKYRHTRNFLETRVIIKILKNPCYPIMFTSFDGNEAKKIFLFFFAKKMKKGRLKKTEFFIHPQKLSNYCQNFMDWSLG